jgi:hypothetical protein
MATIEEAARQLEQGRVVVKTMEERLRDDEIQGDKISLNIVHTT